jgi:hypothetical protein
MLVVQKSNCTLAAVQTGPMVAPHNSHAARIGRGRNLLHIQNSLRVDDVKLQNIRGDGDAIGKQNTNLVEKKSRRRASKAKSQEFHQRCV